MASNQNKRKKILLVEDNKEMLDLITHFLKLRDDRLDVIGLMSAEEGMLELRNVDLLVVDLRLPGMSGIDLIKHARKKAPDLPAIIMSGMERDFARDDLEGVKIEAWVTKPYRPDQVTDEILKAVWGSVTPMPQPPAAKAADTARSDIHHPQLSQDSILRLERLQGLTKAHQVILWGLDGTLLYVFEESGRRNAEKLAKPAISSITGSLELMVRSGSTPSRLITVLDGDPNEIVLAHIKSRLDYCLAIIVDGESKGTKLSTVWGAVQRTVADLSVRLDKDPSEAEPLVEAEPVEAIADDPVSEPEPAAPAPAAVAAAPIRPDHSSIPDDEDLEKVIDGLDDSEEISEEELEVFWTTGLLNNTKSAAVAAQLEKKFDENGDEVIDERWEEVKDLLAEKDTDLLSFDEAQDQGLVDDQRSG